MKNIEQGFNESDTIKYGVECAVIIEQLKILINISTANYVNKKELEKQTPYFSDQKLRRLLNKLVEHGVIEKTITKSMQKETLIKFKG